ncbi:hypothetical protein I79_003143 [Cricetulus griseus]|uniref:Uncharacterized protein n=1 Tax=Cricetulus griseus TaxID=10029 RepID=G3GZ61_CRIGR|nr:hypothetical protein I79_003143 [Cricetulus griseus]
MSNARVYVGNHKTQLTGSRNVAGLGCQAAATWLVGVWQESSEWGQRMAPTGKPQGRTSKLVGTKDVNASNSSDLLLPLPKQGLGVNLGVRRDTHR